MEEKAKSSPPCKKKKWYLSFWSWLVKWQPLWYFIMCFIIPCVDGFLILNNRIHDCIFVVSFFLFFIGSFTSITDLILFRAKYESKAAEQEVSK